MTINREEMSTLIKIYILGMYAELDADVYKSLGHFYYSETFRMFQDFCKISDVEPLFDEIEDHIVNKYFKP